MGTQNKSRRGRKTGNKARKPSAIRYKNNNQRARNKARNVARFERMVAESRARRAAAAEAASSTPSGA